MPKNEGKIFEESFKKSVPKNVWIYRLKDGSANIGNVENSKVRFQCHNIADFIAMSQTYMFILELKSHKGTSIPFSCIRPTQIKEMSAIEHDKIKVYFIFNFRDKEKTYAIDAKQLGIFIETTERKSIPIAWCEENGILIDARRKKVKYSYNLEKLFNEDIKA